MIADPNKITRLSQVLLTMALATVCSVAFTQAQDDPPADKRKRDGDRNRPNLEQSKRDENRKQAQQDQLKRGDQKHRGRPPESPKPPEPGNSRGMPPKAREFSDQVRALHQEIGKLYREGNKEAARDRQNELMKFIREHAEKTRRMGTAIRSSKNDSSRGRDPEQSSPSSRPPSPEAKKEQRNARHLEGFNGEAQELERRIHHLRVAAANLDEGGLREAAEKVRQQSENLEKQYHELKEIGKRQQQERQIDTQERHIDQQEKHIDQQERLIDQQEKRIDQLKNENEDLKKELRKKGSRS